MRKIIAFSSAVIIALTMLPTVAFAARYTDIADTETFDYIIEKIRNEESDYIAERLKLMIYGDEEYNPYGVGERWFDTSSYLNIYDGEIDEKVNMRSSQCYGYANYVYHKLFGKISFDKGNVEVASLSRSNTSVSTLKNAISKARAGAHVRGGGSHSVVYLTTDKDNDGFYYLDAYKTSGRYHIHLTYTTYSQFISMYPSINFILLPEDYPEFNFPEALTVEDFSYPVTKKSSSGFAPSGKVMSNYELTEVYTKVCDKNGKTLFSRKVDPSGKYWDTAWFDNALSFSDITSSGTYTYYLAASDASGAEVVIEKDFSVGSSNTSAKVTVSAENLTPSEPSENYFATVSEVIPSYSRSGDIFTENGVINGKHVILKSLAEVNIGGEVYYKLIDGSWVKASDISALSSVAVSNKPNKTTYYDYEKFKTEGLILTVTLKNGDSFKVSDGFSTDYPKTATGEVKVNVSYFGLDTSFNITVIKTDVVVGEQYEVTSSLRVRAHPGTSHEQLGTLSSGTVITVTEKFDDGEYIWGLIDYSGNEGWCALNYAEYLSGSIVNEISVTENKITLEEGKDKQISAIALPLLSQNRDLTYSTSNPDIATVDSFGNVTAVSSGSVVITVAASNGVKTEVSVTVTASFNYLTYLDAEFVDSSLVVVGIPVEISVSDFTAKYKNAAVLNADGTSASSDSVISTGMIISYGNNQYTVIVLGDANGDGTISSTDFIMCRKSFLGTYSLSDAGFPAADIDGDGKITSTDFMRIRKHYLRLHNIYA